jgi:hypothetical protein
MLIRVDITPIAEAAREEPFCDTSARRVAARSGLSKSAVDRIFKGGKTTAENIGILALTYGVSLDCCITAEPEEVPA